MMMFHAWAVISESFREEDDNDGALALAKDEIFAEIEKAKAKISSSNIKFTYELPIFSNTILHLTELNGNAHFCGFGHWNHRDGRWKIILDLFQFIAEAAPGSYGLLYARDEDKKNEMEVFSMRRGVVSVEKDEFLSPCFPKIEDPL